MRTGSPRSRLPRDVGTRERLREAQQHEAEAVVAVGAAQAGLSRACAKRDAILASASATVDQAQASVQAAQEALARVSGVERAAMLLGVDLREMRKIVGTRNGRSAET